MEQIRKLRYDVLPNTTSKREVVVVMGDPTAEDQEEFNRFGFNVDLAERVKITVIYNDGSGRRGDTFMERERFERLGADYIVEHTELEESKFFGKCYVMISQNDWYNDPARYPEQIVHVDFRYIEDGTGREVYKSTDGYFYLRENFYPRENCAKWYKCGKRRRFEDGDPVTRPNVIFDNHGHREKVRYDDWNGVMAYSDTFNKNFQQFSGVG